jgi:hypothetical protein
LTAVRSRSTHSDSRLSHLTDELVRFGVLFPGGVKVTNLDDLWPLSPDATEAMHGMSPRGGSGSEGEVDQEFWIWPLPETGDLTLVCDWPAYDIAESHFVIDGDRLRQAAVRSPPVWPVQMAGAATIGGTRFPLPLSPAYSLALTPSVMVPT